MKVKVLKDFVCKTGRIRHQGDVIEIHENSPTLPGLLELGFVEWLQLDFSDWEKNGIRSKLANVIIAPEDYVEGDKKHFTYDEAMAVEKKLGNGWRLPTRSEWVLICEEFGQKDGVLDAGTLEKRLSLARNGYQTSNKSIYGVGSNGNYWSSTASSSANAYYLYFSSSDVGPQYSYSRYFGYSVRLVKELGNGR